MAYGKSTVTNLEGKTWKEHRPATSATGEITPMEGRTVASLLEVHRGTLEMEELEQRLEELEARQ